MPDTGINFGFEAGDCVYFDRSQVVPGLAEMFGEDDDVVSAVRAAFDGDVPHDEGEPDDGIPGPNVTRACEVHDLAYGRWEAAGEDDGDILLLLAARMILATQLTMAGLMFVRAEEH